MRPLTCQPSLNIGGIFRLKTFVEFDAPESERALYLFGAKKSLRFTFDIQLTCFCWRCWVAVWWRAPFKRSFDFFRANTYSSPRMPISLNRKGENCNNRKLELSGTLGAGTHSHTQDDYFYVQRLRTKGRLCSKLVYVILLYIVSAAIASSSRVA